MSENKWLHRTFIAVQEEESKVLTSLDKISDAKLLSWICTRWSELSMRVQATLIERLTYLVLLDVEWQKRGMLLYRHAKEGTLSTLVLSSSLELTSWRRRIYRRLAAALVLKEEVKRPSTPYVSKPPTGSVRPCDLRAAAVKAVEIPKTEREVRVLFYQDGKLLTTKSIPVSGVREELPLALTWSGKPGTQRSVTVEGKNETLTILEAVLRLSK